MVLDEIKSKAADVKSKAVGAKSRASGLLHRQSAPPESDKNRTVHHIDQLRDPLSYGLPPKRVANSRAPPNREPTRGSEPQEEKEKEEDGEEDQRSPPAPYRVNTTGLTTGNLPPPPIKRDAVGGRPSAPSPSPSPPKPPRQKPAVPPRLPPRRGTGSPPPAASVSSSGYLNQNAVARLASAGVLLPDFGITKPPVPAAATGDSSVPPAIAYASNNVRAPPKAPLRDGTLPVDPARLRNTASAAHDFQQRHGHQAMQAVQTAGRLDRRFVVTDTAAKYTDKERRPCDGGGGGGGGGGGDGNPNEQSPPAASRAPNVPNGVVAALLARKKPPPPPPPSRMNKPALAAVSGLAGTGKAAGIGDTPPQVPLASRPPPP